MTHEIVIEQRHIEQRYATAAMRIAQLQIQAQDCEALNSARRKAVKDKREDMTEYAEWDGARTELANDTKEARAEIAELKKKLEEAWSRTEEGRAEEQGKVRIRTIRAALKTATQESRQLLIPFVEEV